MEWWIAADKVDVPECKMGSYIQNVPHINNYVLSGFQNVMSRLQEHNSRSTFQWRMLLFGVFVKQTSTNHLYFMRCRIFVWILLVMTRILFDTELSKRNRWTKWMILDFNHFKCLKSKFNFQKANGLRIQNVCSTVDLISM